MDDSNLDILPDGRLGVDDAHIWLIGATIDHDFVVHLQEGISGGVLVLACSRGVPVGTLTGKC